MIISGSVFLVFVDGKIKVGFGGCIFCNVLVLFVYFKIWFFSREVVLDCVGVNKNFFMMRVYFICLSVIFNILFCDVYIIFYVSFFYIDYSLLDIYI